MKQLKARARAEEAVYANKQTSEFLAHAAGLRRLGEWAAEHMMGEGAPAVRDYADTLVRARVVGVDVVESVRADLRIAGQLAAHDEVENRFDRYLAEARKNYR